MAISPTSAKSLQYQDPYGQQALTVANAAASATNNIGLKNRLINGAMIIDQRNAGASGTATGYTIDRWVFGATSTTKGTWQQNAGSVTPPVGFTNYLGFTSNSSYSVGSGDIFSFYQVIEGYNIADLGWGTTDAKTVTVSFWVQSSLTGTFGGSIENQGLTRSYPFTYTINSANTWTKISITIPGDQSGTWYKDNTQGLYLFFSFGVGTNYSGTAGAWASGDYRSATGATSVVGTSEATFYITGVQLEAGTSATSFEYRQYTTELQLCQRYYTRFVNGTGQRIGIGDRYASTFIQCMTFLPTEMRIAPSLISSTGSGYYTYYQAGTAHTFNSFGIDTGTTSKIAVMYNSGDTSGTAGQCGMYQSASASSSIAFNAEL